MFFTLMAFLQKAISAKLLYWQTLRELRALSERDLADLGIRRCDIPFLAKKSADAVR
jgi:uncharacterized protein YjiS (DUF1127 family)